MALRPLAFGLRLRDRDRTLRVHTLEAGSRRSLLEDSRRSGPTQRREHASLGGALADAASTWRKRLH